jgi:methionine salvage enolase-phosphatase E1
MNSAQSYFNQQMQNQEFKDTLNSISEQVDIEWELERVKTQIQNDTDKGTIIKELEKLQKFVHNTMFASNITQQASV